MIEKILNAASEMHFSVHSSELSLFSDVKSDCKDL